MKRWLATLLSPNAADERLEDQRLEARKRVGTAWPPYSAEIDGAERAVLDLGEAGLRVAAPAKETPSVAQIRLRQGGREIKSGRAVRIWAAQGEAGYVFETALDRRESPAAADAAGEADPCAKLRARLKL